MEGLQVWILFGLITFTAAQQTSDSRDMKPFYLVLVPGEVLPGVPLSVSVSVRNIATVTLKARIIHNNHSLASVTERIPADATGQLTFPPINVTESSFWHPYMLEVKGYLGSREVFFNSTYLNFIPGGVTTFIQMDKKNYLPGQWVKIRTVSFRPDGKPNMSPADIYVKDPRGTVLRQWKSADASLWIISKEFQLSENPPLGQWTVVVIFDDISTEKCFNVSQYMMPKYMVAIKVPKVIFREETLWGSVTAEYMHGKHVEGYVNLTFVHRYHGIEDTYAEHKKIDGEVDFKFEVPELHQMNRMVFSDRYMDEECVTITAHVTEALTGLTYKSTANVYLAKYRYNIYFTSYPRILRPELDFTAMLKLSTYNGQPLTPEDQTKTVKVSVMQQKQSPWNWQEDIGETIILRQWNMSNAFPTDPLSSYSPEKMDTQDMEFPVPADGVIPIHVQILKDTATLTIDVSFEDSQNTLQCYRGYTSHTHSYLQILKPLEPAEVGSPLRLKIGRNFPLTWFHYVVKSRGQIVFAGRAYGDLLLMPKPNWAPIVCIVVFFVHENGEIINDSILLPVIHSTKNEVYLSWSETTKKPGDKVTLRVSAPEPSSMVGILVVSESARMKGSRNDVTEEMMKEEMMNLDKLGADYFDWPGLGDPYSIFKLCNLIPLTDAMLPMMNHLPKPEYLEKNPTQNRPGSVNMEEGSESHWNFPETWIWSAADTGEADTVEISAIVPDAITTWTATAFAVSENLGLVFCQKPAEDFFENQGMLYITLVQKNGKFSKLTVFQDLVLSLNLPACVIRGEEFLLEVILFNNLHQDLQVMVIVADNDTFEFIFPDNKGVSMPSVRKVSVGSQSATSVLVPIRPLIIGKIPISVKAMSSMGSDHVHATVLVKGEGIEQSFSASLLLNDSSSHSGEIPFSFPDNVVPGTWTASVSVVGDILVPSISGLDSLIQMPYGCGEQNMINFAPNIYVLQYLMASGQADPAVTEKATDYMMKGYERELSYQRLDGSFSAFGERDSSGSTWLSAFVLRCFLQARPFIAIDVMVLDRAAAWLARQQGPDGRFEEPGRVIHTSLQGGLDGPASLTAFALIALLEDNNIRARYDGQVSAALAFLETSVALGVTSNYSLSLISYALALDGSSTAEEALVALLGRADMIDGVPMWSSLSGGLTASWQPSSADIEMAAYVLLALHRVGHVAEGLPLMQWLSQQRNHNGGFGSTQDTIVALQGLSTFAALSTSANYDRRVTVNTDPFTTIATFHLHQDNHLLLQMQQFVPREDMNIKITTEGTGLVLFQLNVFYNVESEGLMRRKRDTHEQEAFHLHIELSDTKMSPAHLYICSSLSEGLGLEATGMAIMEVGLLSGLSLLPDGVQLDGFVKRVETKAGKVILYLDSVTLDEMCVLVHLVEEFKVAQVREATVLIYDYYEPRRRTFKTYESEARGQMTMCSFCGHDCNQCKPQEQIYINSAPLGTCRVLLSCVLPSLLLILIFL